jgi:phage replication-related protein YjqB (UPF0714/DUF867 family)
MFRFTKIRNKRNIDILAKIRFRQPTTQNEIKRQKPSISIDGAFDGSSAVLLGGDDLARRRIPVVANLISARFSS